MNKPRLKPTKIPWATHVWNPVTGCSPASAGCAHCYAAALSKRYGWPWGAPVFHPDRLEEPANTRKPCRVFVGSMTDLGHEGVKSEWMVAICQAMMDAPWHTYIALTKRPGHWLRLLPQTCWVLVSIEAQEYYSRFDRLCYHAWPCAVKGISAEPLLGPLSLPHPQYHCPMPDWLIAGPETGAGARPCLPAWIDDLEAECVASGIPFFDKRDGAGRRREFPNNSITGAR